jgi:hypothetical protein
MTLVERMDTFPEEFVDTDKWNDFLPAIGHHFKRFNYAERLLIENAWDRLKEDYYPRKARQAIVETLIREDRKEKIRPDSILTTAAITRDALDILNKELAGAYKYANILKGKHDA